LAYFVCDEGQKEFVKTMLTSIGAIAAYEHGIDVVPTHDDITDLIRSAMN